MKTPTFAERLRALIEASGHSTEWIAQHASLSLATVYHLLNGTRADPLWSTVQRLAEAMGISTEKFRVD